MVFSWIKVSLMALIPRTMPQPPIASTIINININTRADLEEKKGGL